MIKGKRTNLHKHNLQKTFNIPPSERKMQKMFEKVLLPLKSFDETTLYERIMDLSNKLYERGYSGLDLMNYIDNCKEIEDLEKYQMLLVFNKIKKDFRNEKIFILFILNFLLLRSNYDLENISFM
jgi:hypothetical protein